MEEFDSAAWAGDGNENKNRLRALIKEGTKIAGGSVASTVGFFAAGPAGAAALGAVGVMASDALIRIGEDVAQRMLGPREKVRVGGVLALSASRIQDRLNAGHQVRTDGFFDQREDARSDADEIAESIILKAQRESEEKKIPYLANILANAAFAPHIKLPLAQQLAKTADALSYRQLCIMRAVSIIERKPQLVRRGNYRDKSEFEVSLLGILYEINDLIQREIVTTERDPVGLQGIAPSTLTLQGLGRDLYDLMELERIGPQDAEEIIGNLNG
ncbi:hypothetical protein GHK38_03615 [Sinorhizobium meliloti]|uniref:hypothetical protein n=1 Tax=Rhizobium meliloti TaxID=382 RepID=UPI000B497030|nr:hypothetical protein [Sinorhizobium meliloti]ASQ03645.1 hypothetical protein CDO23_06570 [Sinorhizobium meliloti]MQV38721.1 hypothetical protein [Sinorhizobium meliloti]